MVSFSNVEFGRFPQAKLMVLSNVLEFARGTWFSKRLTTNCSAVCSFARGQIQDFRLGRHYSFPLSRNNFEIVDCCRWVKSQFWRKNWFLGKGFIMKNFARFSLHFCSLFLLCINFGEFPQLLSQHSGSHDWLTGVTLLWIQCEPY
jgi:hypothetical protein